MPPTDHGKITVKVFDHPCYEPEIIVDEKEYNPKQTMKPKGVTGWGPNTPGKITWVFEKNDDWRFGSIEFEAKDGGIFEFEEVPNAPPPGQATSAAQNEEFSLINKFSGVSGGKYRYKYTIWAIPKNGLGKPLKLDPIIKNEPD